MYETNSQVHTHTYIQTQMYTYPTHTHTEEVRMQVRGKLLKTDGYKRRVYMSFII